MRSLRQQQIVRYLDWQTAQIDKAIRGYERLLALLEERKTAVIVHTVENGLYMTGERRKSVFAWLGDYPAAWRETRLKHVLVKLNRPCAPEDELLICSNKGKVVKRGDSKLGLVSDKEEIYQGVHTGDLLIHGMDTWHGAIAISGYNGKCTPVVHVCDSKQNKAYIAYYLRSLAYKNVYKKISNGVRENTSDFRSWDKMGDLPVILPPIEEQKEIVAYLQDQEKCIAYLACNFQREIDLLRERRTRLIADVVTGQVDVRDIEVPAGAAGDAEVITDGDEYDGAGA